MKSLLIFVKFIKDLNSFGNDFLNIDMKSQFLSSKNDYNYKIAVILLLSISHICTECSLYYLYSKVIYLSLIIPSLSGYCSYMYFQLNYCGMSNLFFLYRAVAFL